MSKRFELLVFDWDGTLHDSIATIVAALRAACRDLGVPEPTDAHARHAIGLGLIDALRHSAPDLDEARYPEMAERYKHHYLSNDHHLSLFAGIATMIEDLHERGYVLAVATGKARHGLKRVLGFSGIERFFSASRCGDECFSKPHPQMLEELMDELLIEPEKTLMIGDTTHDVQMAINAGVNSVAVTYGAHPAEQLAELNTLARLHSVAELSDWLRNNA